MKSSLLTFINPFDETIVNWSSIAISCHPSGELSSNIVHINIKVMNKSLAMIKVDPHRQIMDTYKQTIRIGIDNGRDRQFLSIG